MLDHVDAGLQQELVAQDAALELYLDERMLMSAYEPLLIQQIMQALGLTESVSPATAPILDAGCGVGLVGRLYPHLDLYGVDASLTLLRHAKVGYCTLVECNAESLPFADGTFGLVLALNMLHHMMSPERVIAEFARVLRIRPPIPISPRPRNRANKAQWN